MDKQIKFLTKTLALFSLALVLMVSEQPAAAQDPHQKIQRQITPNDAVIMALPDGRILVGVNTDKPLIPASTLKVLTSLAAIHYLGEVYQYPTDFYTDSQSNLIIKGYGDPLMISEEIGKIATVLKMHFQKINDIVIDDTFFEGSIPVPGAAKNSLQPYDAPNCAVCVNFNTVNFKKNHQQIVSAEPQTPLVKMAMKKIQALTPAKDSGRILLTHDHGDIPRYAGEIFEAFLTAEGIKMEGIIRSGAVDPHQDRLVYRHKSSYDLRHIIAGLMEYSNNFIANQLLLTAGAMVSGPPATLEKGVAAVKQYARERFGFQNLSYVEGSGISRDNRITADMYLEILEAFRPYHTLMPHQGNEYFKTGTLTGISARAGYMQDEKGNLYPFVVFINTPGKTTGPVMDEIRKWDGLFKSP